MVSCGRMQMEADWSVEIGSDLPVMDAAWDGLVDLRSSPEKVDEIEEARRKPAMREALLVLNSNDSPVFTTKCDCWTLSEAEIDPDEFAASRENARLGFASYVDIVDRDRARFTSFDTHEQWARAMTEVMHALDVHQGRVDVVVRAAVLHAQNGFGVTIYAAGCGAREADACAAWRAVLAAVAAATIVQSRASSSIG